MAFRVAKYINQTVFNDNKIKMRIFKTARRYGLCLVIIILFALPVSSIVEGEKRTYQYTEEENSRSTGVFQNLTEEVIVRGGFPGFYEELDVTFIKFVEGVFLEIPVPLYLLTSEARNETSIADLPVPGYDDLLDASCPDIRLGLNFPYWMDQGLDSCLRLNLYYNAINPIFRVNSFPQNESLAQAVSEVNNTKIKVNEQLSIQYMSGTFGEVSTDTRPLYAYNAELLFVTDEDYVGYSVNAWLDLNRTDILRSVISSTPVPSTYGRWYASEEVLYDRSSGWMVLYRGNRTQEIFYAGMMAVGEPPYVVRTEFISTETSFNDRSYGYRSIDDFLQQRPIEVSTYLLDDLSTVDPQSSSPVLFGPLELVVVVVIVSTGFYGYNRWRKRNNSIEGELYPEQ